MQAFCPAYIAICARAIANGGALAATDAAVIIAAHPETERAFRDISHELDAGLSHDAETIANRVNMPPAFVDALLTALRAPGATDVVTVQ
ncbi:MAG: hypothetical protein WDM94_06595 [Bauldia sp.]